jgi:hypothetical protein
MIILFMILIATSFSVLAVSLISKNSFEADSLKVENSIYLAGEFANLRLAFTMILYYQYIP